MHIKKEEIKLLFPEDRNIYVENFMGSIKTKWEQMKLANFSKPEYPYKEINYMSILVRKQLVFNFFKICNLSQHQKETLKYKFFKKL